MKIITDSDTTSVCVGRPCRRRRASGSRARLRPTLDCMEDRALLSTLTVMNNNDSGIGSLRAAILAAQNGDTINFAKSLKGQAITLTSGELDITTSVTIDGLGSGSLAVSGGNAYRVFEIAAGLNVSISGLTISHGYCADLGGGILNDGANLTLSGDDVTQNVVFEDASDGASGGGIYSSSGILNISDSQITGNQALGASVASAYGDGIGGGVYVLDGIVSMNGSTIISNLAQGGDNSSDGYGVGGGFVIENGNVMLSNSTISGNIAAGGGDSGGGGGGAGGLEIAASAWITNCNVTHNFALGGAGSILGYGYGGGFANYGTININDSVISDNLARGGDGSQYGGAWAGGVDVGSGVTTTLDSTISDNLARAADDSSANVAAGGGMELDSSAASAIVVASTFVNNLAIGGNGGVGPFVGEAEAGAIADFGSVSVSSSTFSQNEAIGGNSGNSGPGQVDPGVDESYGGAICQIFETSLSVSGSVFNSNAALGGDDGVATGTDIAEVGVAEGGTICTEIGCTATFTNCSIMNGQAIGGNGNTAIGSVIHSGSGFGAGIYSGFGGAYYGANTLSVTNTLLKNNTAVGGNDNSGTASVFGLVGVGTGGGIMNDLGSASTIRDSEINGNSAIGGNQNTGGGGGLVFVDFGAGGGVFNNLGSFNSSGYGQFDPSVVSISSSVLDFNAAQGGLGGDGEGGGIDNIASSDLMISSSTIFGDQASGGSASSSIPAGNGIGGGFDDSFDSTATVSNTTFVGNLAKGGTGSHGQSGGNGLGGAIFVGLGSLSVSPDDSSLALSGCTLLLNVAQGGSGCSIGDGQGVGGGLYVSTGASATLSKTIVKLNFASTSHDNIYGTVTYK